jgi:hypothetical protein
MNSKLISPPYAAIVARKIFLELHPGEEEWFDLIWNSCTEAPRQIDQITWATTLPGLGALSKEDAAAQQMVKDFIMVAATFLIKTPTACQLLVEQLRNNSKGSGHVKALTDHLCQIPEGLIQAPHGIQYLVWESSRDKPGTQKEGPLSEALVYSKYRAQMKKFDIFIDCGSVWVKPKGGQLPLLREDLYKSEVNLRLLTIIIMHKDRAIDTSDFCRQTLGKEPQQKQDERLQIEHMNALYSRVSRFRDWVRPFLPNLTIDMDSVAGGYRCSGKFSSCVIHADNIAPFLKVELL